MNDVDTQPTQPAKAGEQDAADPRGEYKGPNLTFDRLVRMREFAAKQAGEGATLIKINPETLLCLIDTIQHHEYVLQPSAQSAVVLDDERAADWFAALTGAAASLEDAAIGMTDTDAKSAAYGAAAFYRKRANELGQARAASLRALTDVRQAIADYHFALDSRAHGGVAQDRAFSAICKALDMPWVQGEELKRRADAATQKAKG